MPNTAPDAAKASVDTSGLHVDIHARPPAANTSPMIVRSRSDTTRARKPDASAPSAIAPAIAPSTTR